MRIILALMFSLLFLLSCKNSNENTIANQSLKARIKELEKENKILNDSLKVFLKNDLYSQILVGIPEHNNIKVGKKNKIIFLFHKFQGELPNYEIYKVEGKKETKIGENNKTRFDYEFIPKSITDNSFYLKVKMPYDNRVIEIPAGMTLKVEK